MPPPHILSVAPMMGRTDRHGRYLLRRLAPRALLYTEMVVTGTILHHRTDGLLDRYLGYDPSEHPLALQLGGDDPAQLREAARVGEGRGFDEVNLNVGCPSERVRDGRFGVVLMRDPERVAELLAAMRAAVSIPVTVKHRIGVDELDRYEDLARFVDVVQGAGVTRFVVHARKAWLQGLSPTQNRTIPPLRHPEIHRLKRDFPHLTIVTNGGIDTVDEMLHHLDHVDGVMIGRAAFGRPLVLAEADRRLFGEEGAGTLDLEALVEEMTEYARRQMAEGSTLSATLRHVVPLLNGRPGASRWRRYLGERLSRRGSGPEILREALHRVRAA